MSPEERITVVEQGLTDVQRNVGDLNHNVTILVGMAGSQESDIKTIKRDVSAMKEQLQRMESSFNERLDAIMAMLNRMQPPQG